MKILIIDDRFPNEAKSRIEDASGVEIDVIENYQDAMEKIECGLSEYSLVITDIGLPAERIDRSPRGNGSLFARIVSEPRSIADRTEESMKMYNTWKQQGYQLSSQDEAAVIRHHRFKMLAGQRGLIIAGIISRKGILYTVFTSDIGHALPALDLLKKGRIVSPKDMQEVENAYEVGEVLTCCSKRLALGYSLECKDNPQTWVTLLRKLKK